MYFEDGLCDGCLWETGQGCEHGFSPIDFIPVGDRPEDYCSMWQAREDEEDNE